MKNTFTVTLARPGRHLLTFEAKALKLPAHKGALGIMAGRQPLLTMLEPGVISILDITDHRLLFGTTGGFCEMINNEATLLCDSLITVEDLDNEPETGSGKVFFRDSTTMSEAEKRTYVMTLLSHARKHAV